jgi:hypothetical protein
VEEKRNAYMLLVGNPGERPLGKQKCRCENNIKTDFTETRLEGYGLDSSDSGYRPWQALVDIVMNFWVLYNR